MSDGVRLSLKGAREGELPFPLFCLKSASIKIQEQAGQAQITTTDQEMHQLKESFENDYITFVRIMM